MRLSDEFRFNQILLNYESENFYNYNHVFFSKFFLHTRKYPNENNLSRNK